MRYFRWKLLDVALEKVAAAVPATVPRGVGAPMGPASEMPAHTAFGAQLRRIGQSRASETGAVSLLFDSS